MLLTRLAAYRKGFVATELERQVVVRFVKHVEAWPGEHYAPRGGLDAEDSLGCE